MGASIQPHDCSEAQAHALLCKCLEAYDLWMQRRDLYEQRVRSYAYRAALANLYVYLYPYIQNIVIRWLLEHVDHELLDDQSQLVVLNEVVESHILNVFVAITPLVSHMAIDAHTNAHAEIIALAEDCFYR